MDPKIDTVVLDTPQSATVSGPINWAPAGEKKAWFATAISQVDGGQTVVASGRNLNAFKFGADDRWQATVSVNGNGGQLQRGVEAYGWAVAAIEFAGGAHRAYPWEVDDLTVN
ncbi:MAG: hypothetical protein ACTHNU_16880 [Gaiellales bacterium]